MYHRRFHSYRPFPWFYRPFRFGKSPNNIFFESTRTYSRLDRLSDDTGTFSDNDTDTNSSTSDAGSESNDLQLEKFALFHTEPNCAFYQKLNCEIISEVRGASMHRKNLKGFCEILRHSVESVACEIFPSTEEGIKAKIYGSMATGLSLEGSDLDIAVCGVKFPVTAPVLQLEQKLCPCPWIKSHQSIVTAKVPVLKLVVDLVKLHEFALATYETLNLKKIPLELNVDITFDDSSETRVSPVRYGIQCVEFIKAKLKELPNLKPVVLILKRILSEQGLANPYFGGLCSFGLFLMISAYMKISPLWPTPAHALVEALKYYGKVFDNTKMLVFQGEYVILLPPLRPYMWSRGKLQGREIPSEGVLVYDPFRTGVNVAISVTRFPEIQECFCTMFENLMKKRKKYWREKPECPKEISVDLDSL